MSTGGVRWYRSLLRAYPRVFRDRFSEGMCTAFAHELERRRGVVAVAALWLITVWHVATMAPLERVAEWRKWRPTPSRSLADAAYGVIMDLRVALRSIRANPVLSATVIATLGVGIGGATALFGLVNALAFRPLPFAHDDQLLRLRDTVDRPGQSTWWYDSSERSFLFVQEHATAFSAVIGGNYRQFNVTGAGEPFTIVGSGVSDGWLEALGVRPVLGRGFTESEQTVGDASRAVLLGHELWTVRFGRDPGVVGRALTADGQVYTIVGVMPPGFNFPYGAQLWIMESFDPTETGSGVYVVARRRNGVTPATAVDELSRLSHAARESYPDSHRGIRFTGIPVREDLVGNRSRVGLALLGGVGVLMLIACANVANLLTIRAASRRREFAVRAALGATRWRQVRQVWTETVALTSLGWVLGVVLAVLFGDALSSRSGSGVESLGAFFGDVSIDARTLTFSVALSALTAALTASLPTFKASRRDIRHAIADGSVVGSRSARPTLRAVVVSQMSLALILLLGAGALVDDLGHLEQTELGFERQARLVVPLSISPIRYQGPEERLRLMQTIEDRIRLLPGVRAVGSTQHTPVSLGDWTGGMTIEGGHESTPDDRLLANVRIVTPGYLEALGARLVEGRTFSTDENEELRNVVIVTETMARTHWPSRDPVGRRVKFGPVDGDNAWLTVVGVVRDVKEEWNGVESTWYLPYRQNPRDQMHLIVHHDGEAAPVQAAVRQVIRAVDVQQPVGEIRTLSSLVDESFSPERFGTVLALLFAAFGLTLAALGVYGVLSFAVRQRSREIGLRIALGSSIPGVMRRIVADGLVLLGIATVISLALTPMIGHLARIEWSDGDVNQFRLLSQGVSLTWVRVGAALSAMVLATVVASYLPARRAARVSPASTLREG